MKTTKEKKVISLELSKKIYELAKEKGIELESEYKWVCRKGRNNRGEKDEYYILKSDRCYNFDRKNMSWSALDTTELGELLKDREKRFADAFSYWDKGTWTNSHLSDEIRTEAEARGLMYFYLLDNNLL